MTKAEELQEIQYHLVGLGSFNQFDGKKVAWSLKKNYGLWKRFIFVDCYSSHLSLRDMGEGKWNADTLLIVVKEKFAEKMMAVAKFWKANELVCHKRHLAVGKGEFLIRAWWD